MEDPDQGISLDITLKAQDGIQSSFNRDSLKQQQNNLSNPRSETYLIFVILYTHTIWGLEILYLKVRKFTRNKTA